MPELGEHELSFGAHDFAAVTNAIVASCTSSYRASGLAGG